MCLPDVLLVRIGFSARTGSEYLVVLAGVPLYLFPAPAAFAAATVEEEDDEAEEEPAVFCEATDEAAEEPPPGVVAPPLAPGGRLMRLALSVAGTLDLT